ncbi:MAG: hypothetical protein ABIT01_19830 [Thermoanaerobaculia bacterium]
MLNSRRSMGLLLATLGLGLAIEGTALADEKGVKAPAATPVSTTPTPAAKPPVDSPDPKITLKWSTASEVDNYGYFVFRGEDEKGPFQVLNERAIPGAGNSEVPRDYRYEDHAVTMGKTYFYYLESVSTMGAKEKFSPVLKRECCKLPASVAKEEAKGEKNDEKKEVKKEVKRGMAPAPPGASAPIDAPRKTN